MERSLLENISINRFFRCSFWFAAVILCSTARAAAPDAASIHLTADRFVREVYVNGAPVSLGANSSNWKEADNYGPVSGLTSLAVKVESGPRYGDRIYESGFIGMIVLSDGRRVITDENWKAFYAEGGGAPPDDASGYDWTHPEYDDSAWEAARPDGGNPHGNYGLPPWGGDVNDRGVTYMMNYADGSNLDAYMAVGGNQDTATFRANWIWHGNASFAVSPVYLRRTFVPTAANAAQPPQRPQRLRLDQITSNSVRLQWESSWSVRGDVLYRIYWNGLAVAETGNTSFTVDSTVIPGFNLQQTGSIGAQNYFYVTAVDSSGNESGPSPYELAERIENWTLPKVENLRVFKRESNQVTMIWDQPDTGLPFTTAYDFRFERDGEEVWFTDQSDTKGIYGRMKILSNLQPDTAYTFRVRLFGGGASTATGPWSDPVTVRTGSSVPVPTGLQVNGDTVSWTAPSGSWPTLRYQLYRNGLAWGAEQTSTSVSIAGLNAAESHYIQVVALSDTGNESERSAPLLVKADDLQAPSAPTFLTSIGQTHEEVFLQWGRAEDESGMVAHKIKRYHNDLLQSTTTINDDWQHSVAHDRLTVSGLQSGEEYRFVITGIDPSGNESDPCELTVSTVAPPGTSPKTVFGFAYHCSTDEKIYRFRHIMHDMVARGVDSAVIRGVFGDHGVRDDSQWETMESFADEVRGDMDVHYAVDVYDGMGYLQYDAWGPLRIKYNELEHYEGNPLHHAWDGSDTRFIRSWQMSERDNQEAVGQQFLEQELIRAGQEEVPWVFTFSTAPENTRTDVKLPHVMKQLYGPVITLDRMTNGDPAYDVAWFPGDNWVQAAPARVRTDSRWSYFLVHVFDERVVIEEYKRTANVTLGPDDPIGTVSFQLEVRFEITRDSETGLITPSIANTGTNNPEVYGKRRSDQMSRSLTWAQNMPLDVIKDYWKPVRLRGRSSRGLPLSYDILQQPSHGTLSGTAGDLVYTPDPGFEGEDVFLYQADDGERISNTAWVKLNVVDGDIPQPEVYTLTYSAGTGGWISGVTTQQVVEGSDGSTVTAIPLDGYVFTGWDDGVEAAIRKDTAVSGPVDVTATFAPDATQLIVQWGEATGDVNIVSSNQDLANRYNGGVKTTYEDAYEANPEIGTSYYANAGTNRSAIFNHAASTGYDVQRINNDSTGDFINSGKNLPSYRTMVTWENFLFDSHTLDYLATNTRRFDQSGVDSTFRWILRKNTGEWYASDEIATSASWNLYEEDSPGNIDWYAFDPYQDLDDVTLASTASAITMANVDVVGLLASFTNSSGFCSLQTRYFKATARPGEQATGWEQFIALYGLSGAADDDTDGDGRSDLYEYAFGGNPTNLSAQGEGPAVIVQPDGTVRFRHLQLESGDSGITYLAQWTDNLVAGGWNDVFGWATNLPSSVSNYTEAVYEVNGGTNRNLYFRLSITQP